MEQRTITGPEDLYTEGAASVGYTVDPQFEFETEVDALMTLQLLADDLRGARELERHILRYMAAASAAAHRGTAQDGPVAPQSIIMETGVARQTVYNWIGES
ncbi:hypothetical protein [Nocardia sp. NPDC055049]